MNKKIIGKILIAAMGTCLFSITDNNFVSARSIIGSIPIVDEGLQIKNYDLNFDKNIGKLYSKNCNGQKIDYYAYENVVYVSKPKSAADQSMTIYIPKGYLDGETINGYTAKTAPIFMPNGVGGYMPGKILTPVENDKMSGGGANVVLYALSRGYVVACPAIRGRTTVINGNYIGKAPAFIVDYKAAVRYLKFNHENLPAGDTEKIISNGTSAGGALSALLGVTGNAKEYEPYLEEIGAAESKSGDEIFAASCYCPITNLDHADMAYEWIFNGVNKYYPAMWQLQDLENRGLRKRDKNFKPIDSDSANNPVEVKESVEMNEDEIAVSEILKNEFPYYVNSLDLHDNEGKVLTLDDKGNGTNKSSIKFRKKMS